MFSNSLNHLPMAIASEQQRHHVAHDNRAVADATVATERDAPATQATLAFPLAAIVPYASSGPTSASTIASDELMDFVSATEVGPCLPNVLWGEIGRFVERNDLLHLRTVSKDMAKWVDQSVDRIDVAGKNVFALLATLRHSPNLRHITSLHVSEQPDVLNALFPAIIAALSTVPHSKMHIDIDMQWGAFSNANLALLNTISPASLHLLDMALTADQGRLLAGVPYPLKLSIRDQIAEADIQTLPDIPNLMGLSLDARMNDKVLRAFAGHPALTELEVEIFDVDISDALEVLAGNTQLTKLIIHNTGCVFSLNALTALAANRTIEYLSLSGFSDRWGAGINEQGALTLSQNITIKALNISLTGGYRHLAAMASLERLTIEDRASPITREDAHAFAQRAHLKKLKIVRDAEPDDSEQAACVGALTHLLSSAVEKVHLVFTNLCAEDVVALTANKTLLSFEREYRGFSENDFALTYALAAHPTLRSLYLYPDEDEHTGTVISAYTPEQKAALYAIWAAGKRPKSRLYLDA